MWDLCPVPLATQHIADSALCGPVVTLPLLSCVLGGERDTHAVEHREQCGLLRGADLADKSEGAARAEGVKGGRRHIKGKG